MNALFIAIALLVSPDFSVLEQLMVPTGNEIYAYQQLPNESYYPIDKTLKNETINLKNPDGKLQIKLNYLPTETTPAALYKVEYQINFTSNKGKTMKIKGISSGKSYKKAKKTVLKLAKQLTK